MAKVWLADYECGIDEIPQVCLVCGDEASVALHYTFSRTPGWVHLLHLASPIAVIVAARVLRKSMEVACPFCERHRNHWQTGRTLALLLILGGLLVMAGVASGGHLLGQQGQPPPDWAAPTCLLAAAAAVVTGVVVSNRLIRPVEITRDDIQLTNVSDGFVEALKDKRRADRRADQDDERLL